VIPAGRAVAIAVGVGSVPPTIIEVGVAVGAWVGTTVAVLVGIAVGVAVLVMVIVAVRVPVGLGLGLSDAGSSRTACAVITAVPEMLAVAE